MKIFLISALGLFTATNTLKCEKGFIPDSRNICIRPKYIEGCFTYALVGKCATCNYNYILDQKTGLCLYNAASKQPCCLEQDGKKCRQCNRGMSLVDGSCIQTESLGCLQKAISGQCINCSSDFVLQGGKCLQGIRNCQKYLNKQRTVCQKCYPSYSLANSYCLKNKILGCKIQQKGMCSTCFEPFKPYDGQCDIKNCKEYNDFGCESCECGFYITKKMTCQKVQEGCVRYQKGICTDCFPPFTLQGTVCTIDGCKMIEGMKCVKCSLQYQLADGKCKIPNCLKGMNGKCEICKNGFNYNNGECIAISSIKKVFNS